MKNTETLHLVLKYKEKYENTNIDTLQEHLNIDRNAGQVIWGVFTKHKFNDFSKSYHLDKQVALGIPTFVFLYNKDTQSLYCADYIESYGRKEFPIEDIELIPSYYHDIINMEYIKDKETCQSYVRITNIRKIDFTNCEFIIENISKAYLYAPSNQNAVAYVNIIDDKFYKDLSNDFIAYTDEVVEDVTDNELTDRTIPSDLQNRITIDDNPPKGLYEKINRDENKKNKSRNKSFIETHKKNDELGKLGEEYIYNYELQRVSNFQGGKWLNKVKWISKDNPTSKYDIESVDENGNKIYIEVKTTKGYKRTPFFASIYEMFFSEQNKNDYYLYRLYEFNPIEKKSSMYIKQGSLFETCDYKEIAFKLL